MNIIKYKDLYKDVHKGSAGGLSSLGSDFFSKIEFENIASVSKIISDVQKYGDKAVMEYTKKFQPDSGNITSFRLTEKEIQEALIKIDKETLESIEYAVSNVRAFACAQLDSIKNIEVNISGNTLGHRIIPIESACCYIPGGNYPLMSSAVMTITPAKTAGVKRIIAMSPDIKPAVIAAAHLSGADEIYRIGGVQGIAAAACGTETIKKVNKITGPGNKYVTAAKKQVYGECGIDFLAGPSEVMIIADETAEPEFIAADMLAQCEHDKDARAFLICFDRLTAEKVNECARKYLQTLKTKDTAEISFDKSFAVIADTMDEAVYLANEKAPEHLELCLKNADEISNRFINYGSMFKGNYSAEVFGDYVSGLNHTLPTNQAAKYTGGLSVFDYIKIQTYQRVNPEALEKTIKYSSIAAKEEGLYAHKLAADIRAPKTAKFGEMELS